MSINPMSVGDFFHNNSSRNFDRASAAQRQADHVALVNMNDIEWRNRADSDNDSDSAVSLMKGLGGCISENPKMSCVALVVGIVILGSGGGALFGCR